MATISPVERFVDLPRLVDDDEGSEEFGFDGSVELGSEPEVGDDEPPPPLPLLLEELLSPVVVGLAGFAVDGPEPDKVLCAAAEPVCVPMELNAPGVEELSGSVSLPEEEDCVAAVPVAVPVRVVRPF